MLEDEDGADEEQVEPRAERDEDRVQEAGGEDVRV